MRTQYEWEDTSTNKAFIERLVKGSGGNSVNVEIIDADRLPLAVAQDLIDKLKS